VDKGAAINDNAALISKIASTVIKGQAMGTVGGPFGDHYEFEAQQIGSFSVGGTTIPLTAGPSNDVVDMGATFDLTIREV
jgi:hypothetical protein